MPALKTAPRRVRRPAVDSAVRARILRAAREHFFARGYSAFLMDGLADELGMSKKTLYVHFAGKDALLRAVLLGLAEEVRASAEALLDDPRLGFPEKLRRFSEGMFNRMRDLTPDAVRDLRRNAPDLHQLVSKLRQENIPYIFARLIAQGQRDGLVRADLPPGFAVEFYLQAIDGLLNTAALDRLQLAPREVITRAIDLFFVGLLTPAGREHHETLPSR